MLTDFDRWVDDHGPPVAAGPGGPFWGYIEVVRRLAEKFDVEDACVAGTYRVKTPAGGDELVLPIAVLQMPRATLVLRWDPEAWPNEWTLSVERPAPYRGPVLGLFDPARDLSASKLEGLAPDYLFPALAVSPARFTCELNDEWDLAAFTRLVVWEE